MALDIKILKRKDYAYTVELTGSIDTDTHMKLEEELKEIIDDKTRAIFMDLSGVTYISSIGIRTVIWTEKAMKARKATFAMINLQPQIKKVFEAMNILGIVNIFDDMEEADKYIDQIIKDEVEKQKT